MKARDFVSCAIWASHLYQNSHFLEFEFFDRYFSLTQIVPLVSNENAAPITLLT